MKTAVCRALSGRTGTTERSTLFIAPLKLSTVETPITPVLAHTLHRVKFLHFSPFPDGMLPVHCFRITFNSQNSEVRMGNPVLRE